MAEKTQETDRSKGRNKTQQEKQGTKKSSNQQGRINIPGTKPQTGAKAQQNLSSLVIGQGQEKREETQPL
jgi:hypothetical protein